MMSLKLEWMRYVTALIWYISCTLTFFRNYICSVTCQRTYPFVDVPKGWLIDIRKIRIIHTPLLSELLGHGCCQKTYVEIQSWLFSLHKREHVIVYPVHFSRKKVSMWLDLIDHLRSPSFCASGRTYAYEIKNAAKSYVHNIAHIYLSQQHLLHGGGWGRVSAGGGFSHSLGYRCNEAGIVQSWAVLELYNIMLLEYQWHVIKWLIENTKYSIKLKYISVCVHISV